MTGDFDKIVKYTSQNINHFKNFYLTMQVSYEQTLIYDDGLVWNPSMAQACGDIQYCRLQYVEEIIVIKMLSNFTDSPNDEQLAGDGQCARAKSLSLFCKT